MIFLPHSCVQKLFLSLAFNVMEYSLWLSFNSEPTKKKCDSLIRHSISHHTCIGVFWWLCLKSQHSLTSFLSLHWKTHYQLVFAFIFTYMNLNLLCYWFIVWHCKRRGIGLYSSLMILNSNKHDFNFWIFYRHYATQACW